MWIIPFFEHKNFYVDNDGLLLLFMKNLSYFHLCEEENIKRLGDAYGDRYLVMWRTIQQLKIQPPNLRSGIKYC